MKYTRPEMTVLAFALHAVQGGCPTPTKGARIADSLSCGNAQHTVTSAYEADE